MTNSPSDEREVEVRKQAQELVDKIVSLLATKRPDIKRPYGWFEFVRTPLELRVTKELLRKAGASPANKGNATVQAYIEGVIDALSWMENDEVSFRLENLADQGLEMERNEGKWLPDDGWANEEDGPRSGFAIIDG